MVIGVKSKLFIMAFTCLIMMTHFFFLSFHQGVEDVLLKPPFNFSNTKYGLFFGASAIPNLINPFFLGFYIDKRGFNAKVIIFLSFFLFSGLLTLIIGTIDFNFYILFLGNLFLGMTVENLSLIAKKILITIFDQKKNVEVTGFLLFFGRAGLIVTTTLIPFIYEINERLSDVYFFGGIVAFISMISLLAIHFLLPKEERNLEKKMNLQVLKEFFSTVEKSLFLFWLVTLFCVINFYGFFANANTFLVSSMKIGALTAGIILIFLVASLAVFQIVFSILMSKFGYLNIFLVFGCLCYIISLGLFICFFQIECIYLNILPLVLLGFAYAVASNYFYSITPILVTPINCGTALGILQCVMSFGRFFGPVCFGIIRDLTMDYMSGYFYNFIFQIAVCFLCMLATFLMFITIDGGKIKGITNNFFVEKEKLELTK